MDLGFRTDALGFGVCGSGFRVSNLGFEISGSELNV